MSLALMNNILAAENSVSGNIGIIGYGRISRALAPLLEAAAAARKGEVALVKVDVDLCPELWRRYEVSNIPAVKAFRDAEVVAEFTGMQPRDTIERFFDELLASWARAPA